MEPWDKVTGEIYPAAVEYWKDFDLANHIVTNWNNSRNLGEALRRRVFIYVGSWDNYFLNEGVIEFQKTVSAYGGADWTNVTILDKQPHGGNYQRRETWNYLEFVNTWIQDHSPTGKTPLSAAVTAASGRGNQWAEVIARGGHQAALARQVSPVAKKSGNDVTASVGRWDPGVVLQAQWLVNGKVYGKAFSVKQGDVVTYKTKSWRKKAHLALSVTGRKRGYVDEKRISNSIWAKR